MDGKYLPRLAIVFVECGLFSHDSSSSVHFPLSGVELLFFGDNRKRAKRIENLLARACNFECYLKARRKLLSMSYSVVNFSWENFA